MVTRAINGVGAREAPVPSLSLRTGTFLAQLPLLSRRDCSAARYNAESCSGELKHEKAVILAGVLASLVLLGVPAVQAQHKVPNQQPTTAAAPTAPPGEVTLGAVRIPRGVTADGKPLPAGSYQVKVTPRKRSPKPSAPPNRSSAGRSSRRRVTVKGREVVTIVPASRNQDGREGRPAARRRRQGADAPRQRLPSRVGQQGREPLPDSPARLRTPETRSTTPNSDELRS